MKNWWMGLRREVDSRAVTAIGWPVELRPGDERIVQAGLRIGPGRDRLRVQLLFGDALEVTGAYQLRQKNTFEFPSCKKEVAYAIMYCCAPTSLVGARLDVGAVVSTVRWTLWKVFLGCALVGIAVAPVVIQMIKSASVTVQFSVGNLVVVSLPFAAMLAAIVSWRRILPVVSHLLIAEGARETIAVTDGPSQGHILIVEQVNNIQSVFHRPTADRATAGG